MKTCLKVVKSAMDIEYKLRDILNVCEQSVDFLTLAF
jgi:hypothetical protein